VERARAVVPDFALTPENAAAVAELCAQLDGLPLAIELVAPRLKLLSPGGLLERMSGGLPRYSGAGHGRLPLLNVGARDVPARQRTLHAAIAWSYDLLSEAERILFRRLAVFAGGCTVEAAEAVAAGCESGNRGWEDGGTLRRYHVPTGQTGTTILDAAASLIDQSLLQWEAVRTGARRPRMLETGREFALERLRESGEAAGLGRRHAEHYTALVQEAEPELHRAEQAAWLSRLEQEHDNLPAALTWSLATVAP